MLPLVIYADVLVVINLFVNYFLLLITKRLLRVSVRRVRILCGAILGGLYSLILFAPKMPIALTLLLHTAAVGMIVAVSIPVHTLKAYLKAYAAFFAVNFGFGGAMLAVWLVFRPNGMVYQNGAVYFNISIQVLLLSTVLCYILFSVIFFLLKRKAPDNKLYSVILQNGDKSVHTNALFDTGNTLTDGFSDTPILIATEHILNKLTNEETRAFLRGDTPQIQNTAFRLIPCATVHGNGILRGIVIDSATLPQAGVTVRKPILVQTVERIDTTEYDVILSNQFFERGEKSRVFQTAKNPVKN